MARAHEGVRVYNTLCCPPQSDVPNFSDFRNSKITGPKTVHHWHMSLQGQYRVVHVLLLYAWLVYIVIRLAKHLVAFALVFRLKILQAPPVYDGCMVNMA